MTNFKFSPLALAAHQALKPTAPPPQADTDPEQGRAALDQMAKALETREPEAGESHETAGKVEILSNPRAGDQDADGLGDAVDVGASTMAGLSANAREQARSAQAMRQLVGSRIREVREMDGVSQGDFAAALGYAASAQVSQWEHGKRLPPMHEFPAIARALGVSVDYLLGVSDEFEHDVGVARRTLLVGHLRDQLQAVAEGLADTALVSGAEVEASLRSTRLLTRCEAMQMAVARFQSANADSFEDMPAGALLVRAAKELVEAATTVATELDGVGHRRERSAKATKAAMSGGVR